MNIFKLSNRNEAFGEYIVSSLNSLPTNKQSKARQEIQALISRFEQEESDCLFEKRFMC